MEEDIDDFEINEIVLQDGTIFNEVHVTNIERIKVGFSIADLENFIIKNPNDLIDISKEIERLKSERDDLIKSHYCNQIQKKIRQCSIRNYNDYSFLIRLVCVLDLQNSFMGSNVSLLRHIMDFIPIKLFPEKTLANMMNTMANEIVSVSFSNGDRIHLLTKIACTQSIWKPMTVLVAWLTLNDIFNISHPVPFSFENLKFLLAETPLPVSVLKIKLAVHAIIKIVFNCKVTRDDEEWLKLWLKSLGSKMEHNFLSKHIKISTHNLFFINSMINRVIYNWPSFDKD